MEQQTPKSGKRAVVLLSGGIDSATVLAIARDTGYETFALTVDYGQRHRFELTAAALLAKGLGAKKQTTVSVDLRAFGGSSLTDAIDVPKDRAFESGTNEIPITYVPARNTIFLSLALAHAEVIGAGTIFIGANAVDYSGYPDCRPEYIEAFQRMAQLATRVTVEGSPIAIAAPLLHMKKAEIIREGFSRGVDFAMTTSCYDPDGQESACGRCDACVIRRKGFQEANIPDPTRYVGHRVVQR